MKINNSSNQNILFVGFDEAGRGPLAGPVVAGAVILPQDFPFEILNDSKKLSEKKRNIAEKIIKEKACWGIGIVDHNEIDKINILQASMKAMQKAYDELQIKLPVWVTSQGYLEFSLQGMTDGNKCPDVPFEIYCEPKADAKYPHVMAASILAKTCRDNIMNEMDKLYPQYNYAKHKGYPTPEHKKICRELGPSPIQRHTFKY